MALTDMSNAPEDSLDFAARVSLRAAGDADLELFELWRKNASPTEHQPEVSSERDIGDRRIPLVDEPLQPAQRCAFVERRGRCSRVARTGRGRSSAGDSSPISRGRTLETLWGPRGPEFKSRAPD